MSSRIAFTFPPNYDPAKLDRLVLAINQRLDELSSASSADSTVNQTIPTLTEPLNDLAIGRGVYFEFVATNSFGSLTGMAGGTQGRLIIIKNSDQSNADVGLIHNSSASTPGNRFLNRDGTDYFIQAGHAVLVMYSNERRGWVPVAEVP